MRLPKGPFSSQPGSASPVIEHCHARGVYPEFYDPDGTTYGLPTYPFHAAPRGMATLRQLRERGLRPGGQPVQAQIVWKHRGPQRDRDGQGRTTCRVAYLFKVADAKPKRAATPAQREAIGKALAARRTCPSCGAEQDYYISRSLGECNQCADPELYAAGGHSPGEDQGWGPGWDDQEWDPGQPDPGFAQSAELEAG
jgi:hypothetical protein